MNYCYVCNEPSVSDEHIPPKCLFPENKDLPPGLNLRKNLITVPSCAEHNLNKSGDDEYLLFVLVANFHINSIGLRQWQTKIRRAMRNHPSKRGVFKNIHLLEYYGVLTGGYSIDFKRISRQFDLISRGIYFSHFQKPWTKEIYLAIPFIFSTGSMEAQKYSNDMKKAASLASEFLKDEYERGENKEVFYYQYKVKPDSPGFALRMVFYGGVEVMAISSEPIQEL